jgi:hypothetical protein
MRKVFVEPVVLPESRFRDGLGIRYVRTDGSDDPVEVLRPLWELAAIRASIQNRVDRLVTFRQARFVPVRRAEVPPDDGSTIEVVSDYVSGHRLSSILEVTKTGSVVVETHAALHVVRELLGAIAVLHESRGVTHGAIGPERILITPRGRMVVTDYVLGSAIERLEYPRSRLWREFHIPMPPGTGLARFDESADVIQIGVAALALLIGRPLDLNDYPDRLSVLVESIGAAASHQGRQPLPTALVAWLKRMLPHEQTGRFATVREARVALESVLSKQRLAVAGAEALKSLAEACQPHLEPAGAAPAPKSRTPRTRAVAGVQADTSAEQGSARPEDTSPPESGTDLVSALTLLTAPSVEATIDVESPSRGFEVAPAFLLEADPPVGWRVPETGRGEEPLVAGPMLQAPPAAVAPREDSDFVEEVLDLAGLLDDEPATAGAQDEGVGVDEPAVAAPLLVAEPVAAVPVPPRSFVEDVLDLVELREEAPPPVEAPLEMARVEEAIKEPVDEPVVTRLVLGDEVNTIELQPESSSIEDILDLLECRAEASSLAEAPSEMARVEEPIEEPVVTRLVLGDEVNTIELQPESSSIEDILDLLERRAEAPSPAEAPPEMARVEEPIEIPVDEPIVTRLVLGDEVNTIELQPESSSIEDILDLLERRAEAPSPAEAPPEMAREEEPVFTSHLAPTDPPVGWHVPAHRRGDELKVENRLFQESTRGEDGNRYGVPADRRSTVPPPSSEPASIGAVLPPDWLIDVEVAPIELSGMRVIEIGAKPLPPHEQETMPAAFVRPEPPDATAVVDRADTTLTQAYDYEPAPVPSQPVFRAAEHVADAEPVVTRVAPSVQRVRAAAARRRLTRARTGIAHVAEASGGMLRAGLAGIGSACSSVAGGTARSLTGLAQGLRVTARAAGASGVEMLAACARAVRAGGAASAATLSVLARGLGAGVRSLGAVCVLAVTASGRVVASIGRGGRAVAATVAVGSLWSLRAIGRAGRATAGAALTSSARAIRATRTVGMATLTLMARALRAGRGVGALLLTGIGRAAVATARAGRASAVRVLGASTWAIRSAGSGGAVIVTLLSRAFRGAAHAAHGVGSTAVAGTARALRICAGAGRAGSTRALAALRGGARGTVHSSAALRAASVPVVMRASRATVRVGRTIGAAALAAPVRGYYLVGDLAARFLRPVLRPGYLFAALLVIASVAGVPFAKAYWFSLKPQTGTLRVEPARPGLTVRIDGVAHGTPPLSTALAVGRHRIEVDGGGRTRSQDVVVTTGQDTVVQLSGGATGGAGTLRLMSEPAGAQVWLDGALHGTAPLTIDNVAEGSHTVVVRDAGGSVRQNVRVRPDETVEATIAIRPGWLAVFAPIRLDIVEDGRVIGTTEGGRLLTKPGEHTLELVGGQIGFRETRKVDVKPGEVAALTIQLPTAMLEVLAPADAEILIDGQLVGMAPLAPVAVAAGTREVTMRHPTLGEQRQTTTITYRTPNRVVFEPRN